MWNIGSGSQKRSPEVIRNFVRCTLAPWRTSASWLSRQPLGLAVVPDVYISSATSRIRTRACSALISSSPTPCAAASNAVRERKPGRSPFRCTSARRSGADSSSKRPRILQCRVGEDPREEGRDSRPWPPARGAQQHRDVGVGDHVAELVLLEPPVDRNRNCAELGRSDDGRDEVQLIGHQDPDLVVRPHAQPAQRAREPVAERRKLRKGDPLVGEDDRVSVGGGGRPVDEVADGRCFGENALHEAILQSTEPSPAIRGATMAQELSFDLPEELELFRRETRAWVDRECPEGLGPRGGAQGARVSVRALGQAHGGGVPRDRHRRGVGGQGGDVVVQMVLARELARSLGGLAWIWGITSFAGAKSDRPVRQRGAEAAIPARDRTRASCATRSASPSPAAAPTCSARCGRGRERSTAAG